MKPLQITFAVFMCVISACAIPIKSRSDLVTFKTGEEKPISKNSCIFIVGQPSYISDMPLIVCKTEATTITITCLKLSNKDLQKVLSTNFKSCKNATAKKETITQYQFPSSSISGGSGTLSTIGAATIGAVGGYFITK